MQARRRARPLRRACCAIPVSVVRNGNVPRHVTRAGRRVGTRGASPAWHVTRATPRGLQASILRRNRCMFCHQSNGAAGAAHTHGAVRQRGRALGNRACLHGVAPAAAAPRHGIGFAPWRWQGDAARRAKFADSACFQGVQGVVEAGRSGLQPSAASVPHCAASVPDPKAPPREPPKPEPPRRDPSPKKPPRRDPVIRKGPLEDPPAEPPDPNEGPSGPIGDPQPERSVVVR